jgi:hypothetical protein
MPSRRRAGQPDDHELTGITEGTVVPMTTTSTAQALFASHLQPSDRPTTAQVEAAVIDSLHRHGGTTGCAAVCATAYGDHPDAAPTRMRWARTLAQRITPHTPLAA